MTGQASNIMRLASVFCATVFCVGMLASCDNPKNDIKDIKSKVQLEYGQKKFKDSAKHAADGLKLALETFGPKNPDTLYFAQAIAEGYLQLNDKKNALPALVNEIDLRIGAGQTEQKLQARRTIAIKFAEEIGDRGAAAKQAVALSKAMGMAKGMDPQPVYRPETKYPVDLYTKGVEGDVTIAYSLDAGGSVLEAKVVKSVPKEMFDTVAMTSFKTWRFTPMLEEGAPVKSAGHQFTLQFRTGKR